MKVASVLIGTGLLSIVGCHSPLSVSSNHVWAIVKISYDPATLKAKGGTCGTVFFVNETNFVTAHPTEIDSGLFVPNKGYPNVRVFLANAQGDTIEDFWIVSRAPEHDLAIGRVRTPHPHVLVCQPDSNVRPGDEVYNIGFPTNQVPDISLRMQGHKLIVEKIRISPSFQHGTIEAIMPLPPNAKDQVKIQNQPVIILNHSSTTGFSGGPLVARRSGKVVGMMSFVTPATAVRPEAVAAIPIANIQPHILASDPSRTGEGSQKAPSKP